MGDVDFGDDFFAFKIPLLLKPINCHHSSAELERDLKISGRFINIYPWNIVVIFTNYSQSYTILKNCLNLVLYLSSVHGSYRRNIYCHQY